MGLNVILHRHFPRKQLQWHFVVVAVPGLLLMSTLGERGAGLGRTLSSSALAAVECWAFLMLVPSASHTCSPRVSCTVKIWNSDTRRERNYPTAATFLPSSLWNPQSRSCLLHDRNSFMKRTQRLIIKGGNAIKTLVLPQSESKLNKGAIHWMMFTNYHLKKYNWTQVSVLGCHNR